jgi:hypothetical protein
MAGTIAEIKVRKMPWITIVIFSGMLSSIISLTQAFTLPLGVARSIYTLGIAPCGIDFPMASFAFLLVLPLLRKFEYLRKRVDNEMVAYLFIAALCVSWTGNQMYCTEMETYFSDRIQFPADTMNYIPSTMAPSTAALTPWVTGGAGVPWGDWAPVILWWSARHIFIVLLMVSLTVILRKSWIDMERIPFQQSIMAYELAKVSMGGRSKLLQSKAFAVGILLGIVFQLPIFLSYIYPWFPDIYGWRVNTCSTGAYYVPAGSPLLAIIGLSNIQKNPATYALMFLAPLKVLFSTWVWYIVYLVLIQISWVEGFYTGMDVENGCCRGYSGRDTPLWGPPFKFMALSFAGGFSALAIIYLFLNRTYLAQTLKAAIGKLSPDIVQDLERNEALTYRQAWSLFASAFILNILIYAVVGVSPYSAFVLTGGLLILWIGMARLAGLTGINSSESVDHGNTFLRLFVWPQAPQPLTQDFMLTSAAAQWASQPYYPPYGLAIVSSFAGFRFASSSGADNKNVFKVVVLALSVGFVASFLTIIPLNYSFGIQRLSWSGFISSTEFRNRTGNPDIWNTRPGTEPLAPYVLGGFAIVGALYFLSARFVWFPLEPVGFILGTSMLGAGLLGFWMPALVCWIAKTLTLRIGGSKMYEERAVPLASGFVAGYALITVIAVFVFVVRFFYPF